MPSKKLKLIAVISAIAIIGSVYMMGETPLRQTPYDPIDHHTPADVVIEYNFDDGNLSDWSWFAIDDDVPYNWYPGNVTAVNGTMKHGPDHWNIAFVNSSVAYGTWSLDVFVEDQPIDHEIVIPFILIEYNNESYLRQAYIIQIITGYYPSFLFPGTAPDQLRLQAGKAYLNPSNRWGRDLGWLAQYNTDDIWGWKNFIITREDNGQFYVYMNGSLVLDYKDAQYTTCNYFGLSSRIASFDNIVVSNTVDYDAAPPEWVQEPTNQEVAFGKEFRYDLNATDFSGLGTWGLNDTTNFAIDSNGVITNAVGLALGVYALNVSVSDSQGYTRSAEFTVTVQTTAQPYLTLYAVAGVGAFVIVALAVVVMKKRG